MSEKQELLKLIQELIDSACYLGNIRSDFVNLTHGDYPTNKDLKLAMREVDILYNLIKDIVENL